MLFYRHALAIAAALSPAAASRAAAPGRPACLLSVDVTDPDPAGTNVRSGPSPAARVIARLPQSRPADGYDFRPELEVIGFDHGWAHVRNIRFVDYGHGETLLLRGSGWISGRLLSAELSYMPSRDKAAALAVTRRASDAQLETAVVENLDDCSGNLAHVTVRFANGRRITGWTRDLCANQATTCS